MGLSDPRRSPVRSAIVDALQSGGTFRVVVGANGGLKAESDEPPVTLTGDTHGTDQQSETNTDPAKLAEGHGCDLPADEV